MGDLHTEGGNGKVYIFQGMKKNINKEISDRCALCILSNRSTIFEIIDNHSYIIISWQVSIKSTRIYYVGIIRMDLLFNYDSKMNPSVGII